MLDKEDPYFKVPYFPQHKDTSAALRDMILNPAVKYAGRSLNSGHLEFWHKDDKIRCIDVYDRWSGYLTWTYMDFLTLHKSFTLTRVDPKPEKKEHSAEEIWTNWLGIPGR